MWPDYLKRGCVCDMELWDAERCLEPYCWQYGCGATRRVSGCHVVSGRNGVRVRDEGLTIVEVGGPCSHLVPHFTAL